MLFPPPLLPTPSGSLGVFIPSLASPPSPPAPPTAEVQDGWSESTWSVLHVPVSAPDEDFILSFPPPPPRGSLGLLFFIRRCIFLPLRLVCSSVDNPVMPLIRVYSSSARLRPLEFVPGPVCVGDSWSPSDLAIGTAGPAPEEGCLSRRLVTGPG